MMRNEVSVNCCRICLTKSKKLRSLYKPVDEGDEPPNEMLQQVTGIQVEKMDQLEMLPKSICKNCELSLSMAFEFRIKALQTQNLILAYLKDHKIAVSIEKQETQAVKPKSRTKAKIEKDNDDDILEIQQLNESTLEENLHMLENTGVSQLEISGANSIQLEELQLPQKFENDVDDYDDAVGGDRERGDMLNEECLEDTEIYEGEEHEVVHQYYEEFEEGINEVVHLENDEDDVLQLDDEDEGGCVYAVEEIEIATVRRRKPKPSVIRGKVQKKSSNSCGHICDICGNVYKKKGRMMEHRQRHDKELKYACELCDKKFHLRELLRKHMYSHSGGKPLKCKYCTRSFYYESVRKAHEAVHQGVKPYVCDVCNKPFSYAHSLKKHKLIHAEVKLYRCDLCNKDFRLQHHMKQHEHTKLHQKAVFLAGGHYSGKNATSTHMVNDHDLGDDIMVEEEEIVEDDEIDNIS